MNAKRDNPDKNGAEKNRSIVFGSLLPAMNPIRPGPGRSSPACAIRT